MIFDSEKFLKDVKRKIPKFKIVDKKRSKFMKFINIFVKLFNPDFLNRFITTIGYTVYWPKPPKDYDDPDDFYVLWHEAIHACQAKRWTRIGFGFLYLFPQSLSVFALLAVLAIWFSGWWLLALTMLISLAPWPAPLRVYWELQAKRADIHVHRVLDHDLEDWIIEQSSENFCGWNYYKMSWNKKKTLKEIMYLVQYWKFHKPIFGEVKKWLRNH